jgi:hypothetical protein
LGKHQAYAALYKNIWIIAVLLDTLLVQPSTLHALNGSVVAFDFALRFVMYRFWVQAPQ